MVVGDIYTIVTLLASLVHEIIKKNRKEKHCGFHVLSLCARPELEPLHSLHPDKYHWPHLRHADLRDK